jgi:hypothetical protein
VPEVPLGAWGDEGGRYGEVRGERVVLRAAPSDGAKAVATIRPGELDADFVDVLDARGAFLRVAATRRDADPARVEGWVRWGGVVPSRAALVVDAATGALVARLPIEDSMTTVTFSPTGDRAVLAGGGAGCGETYGSDVVYEVRTSDFAIARVVRAPAGRPGTAIAAAFYDPADGGLEVAVLEPEEGDGATLFVARVDETGVVIAPRAVASGVESVATARGGRLGVAFLRRTASYLPVSVILVDMPAARVLRTFTLDGDAANWFAYDVALSADGSEVTGLLDERLVTISTRTGTVVRSTPVGARDREFVSLDTVNVLGDSVLLNVVREGDEVVYGPGIWVRGRATWRAARRFDYVCEAAGARFAVDEAGNRLFRLAPGGAVAASVPIARTDTPRAGDAPWTFGLAAYPDASRVVMIVGFEYG